MTNATDDRDELLLAIADRLIQVEQKVDALANNNNIPSDNDRFPGLDISSWTQEALNPPGQIDGIVVDDGLARVTPCHRVILGPDSELVYSKGIVGALNEEQKLLYCDVGIEDRQASSEQKKQLQTIRDAAIMCQTEVAELPKGQRLEPFLKCISVTAKKSGVNI